MNAIDDPVIPDDLGDLLRQASASAPVAPAAIDSVHRRARQRRRRRHGLVAGGAAAVVLLAGLAVAQVANLNDGPEQVITATTAAPALAGTVPQPLLLWGEPLVASPTPNPNPEPVEKGTWLDEITPAGPKHWWHSPPGTQGVKGVVLADGRRFGLAVAQSPTGGSTGATTLDAIGADNRTTSSVDVTATAEGDSESSWMDLIGASGSEVILKQQTESAHTPMPGGGYSFKMYATITARDVDTGAERTIVDKEVDGASAAAANRLAIAPGTGCTIEVRSLDGTGAARTLDGGCPPRPDGLGGMAQDLALSSDGRYAAVIWNEMRDTGSSTMQLVIVDLDTGRVAHSQPVDDQWPVTRMAWTGERTLTVAAQPGTPALPTKAGPAEIVTVRYVGP